MHRSTPPSTPAPYLPSLLLFGGELPPESDPVGAAVREFFKNNWQRAREGLLSKTDLIRVEPQPPEGPRSFSFEMDLPYKRKLASGEVVLEAGPIRGALGYHVSVLGPPLDSRSIVAFIMSAGFFHPNFSRAQRVLCLGDLPRRPFQLDRLLEHLWGILSYQNLGLTDLLDVDAARYFATDPHAYEGIDAPPALY